MKLAISADIELDEPTVENGYVTWLDVRAYADDRTPLGSARVAIVHVGEISDAHGDLWPALRGTKLESLHDAYFQQGWYNDDFADGSGIDLLFIERVTVDDGCKNLDLAIVRRLADTIGSGCQLVVMRYGDAFEAAKWARLGFTPTTRGRSSGLMHMKLGYRHARVVDTGTGTFEVVPTDGNPPTSLDRRAAN